MHPLALVVDKNWVNNIHLSIKTFSVIFGVIDIDIYVPIGSHCIVAQSYAENKLSFPYFPYIHLY